jgi:hypothetical protein
MSLAVRGARRRFHQPRLGQRLHPHPVQLQATQHHPLEGDRVRDDARDQRDRLVDREVSPDFLPDIE